MNSPSPDALLPELQTLRTAVVAAIERKNETFKIAPTRLLRILDTHASAPTGQAGWQRTDKTLPDADDGDVMTYASETRTISLQDAEHLIDLVRDAKRNNESSYYTHWRYLPESP